MKTGLVSCIFLPEAIRKRVILNKTLYVNFAKINHGDARLLFKTTLNKKQTI